MSVTSLHLRTQSLLARESQQLPHKVRRAVGVLLDLHDIGKGWIACLMTQKKKIAEPDNGGEQIVEVVRDAARELSHRLHLLRLHELRLQLFLLG